MDRASERVGERAVHSASMQSARLSVIVAAPMRRQSRNLSLNHVTSAAPVVHIVRSPSPSPTRSLLSILLLFLLLVTIFLVALLGIPMMFSNLPLKRPPPLRPLRSLPFSRRSHYRTLPLPGVARRGAGNVKAVQSNLSLPPCRAHATSNMGRFCKHFGGSRIFFSFNVSSSKSFLPVPSVAILESHCSAAACVPWVARPPDEQDVWKEEGGKEMGRRSKLGGDERKKGRKSGVVSARDATLYAVRPETEMHSCRDYVEIVICPTAGCPTGNGLEGSTGLHRLVYSPVLPSVLFPIGHPAVGQSTVL